MRNMKQLARDVKKLEKQLAGCTRCGMCQSNCPLFVQTRKEADVSRGKYALLTGLIDETFDNARGVNERLKRCLLCGSCTHGCPSNVNAVEIFLQARSIITEYLGLSFSKKIMFRKVLSNPETFHTLTGMIPFFQKVLFKKQDNLQGTSCARIASPLLRHRHLTPLKGTAFNKTLEGRDFRREGKEMKVAFFVGCLIDKAFPGIAESVVDVLTYFNAGIFIPAGQGCCGIPAMASGDRESFETLVRHHIELFSGEAFDYLVTACATCTSTIVKLWPALLQDADEDLMKKLKVLAEKTVDISWLMAKHFPLSIVLDTNSGEDRESKERITYHDPCHLKKSLGVSREPREVILASGNELVEMEGSDTCCGMGGSFNLEHYEISSKIGGEKAQNIIDTGCTTVTTSCPACMMQISDYLAKREQDILVKHPVEIIADKIRPSLS